MACFYSVYFHAQNVTDVTFKLRDVILCSMQYIHRLIYHMDHGRTQGEDWLIHVSLLYAVYFFVFVFWCPQLRLSWGGMLVWACPSVCQWVHLSAHNAFWQLGNSRTAYARIFKFYIGHIILYMKNKRTFTFFYFHPGSCRSGIMPLFQLCHFI